MEKSEGEEMEKSEGEAMEVDAGSRSMTELTTGEEHPERSTEEVTTGAPCKQKRKIAEQAQETEIENKIEEQTQREIEEEFDYNILIDSPPILDANIENRAGCLKIGYSGVLDLELMDPEKEFYLVDALPMPGKRNYYKHLIVNNSVPITIGRIINLWSLIMGMSYIQSKRTNELVQLLPKSTRENNFNSTWSIDPETDRQYVRFYSKLEECISNKVPSWKEYVSGCLSNDEEFISKKRDYEAKAMEIGKKPEFSKLGSYDIFNCILKLIKEKSLIIERLELSKEFLFCLLDCNGEEEISDKSRTWANDGRHRYLKSRAVRNFKDWLNQPGIRQMTKEEKKTELRKYHEKRSKEDCSSRIRYLRIKLELAQSLGLIPSAADSN